LASVNGFFIETQLSPRCFRGLFFVLQHLEQSNLRMQVKKTELKEAGDGINRMIERILGTEAGTLNIYDFDLIFQHRNGGKHDTA